MDAALVVVGAGFVAALAQVEVPLWPVPITGQTLGVVVVGAALGARRGAAALLTYLVAGLATCLLLVGGVGGLAAVHQRTRVGRHAMVGGLAAVVKDVIPYGSVWGNHAHLEGLNLLGLKRRGFSRETINTMRAAYRMLFADEGTFQERLDDTVETYSGSPEVMEIIDFIRADANRPLCLPEREV